MTLGWQFKVIFRGTICDAAARVMTPPELEGQCGQY